MSHNMSIYRRLNPRLLVQARLDLGLLHWTNICLIYISNNDDHDLESGQKEKTKKNLDKRTRRVNLVCNIFIFDRYGNFFFLESQNITWKLI